MTARRIGSLVAFKREFQRTGLDDSGGPRRPAQSAAAIVELVAEVAYLPFVPDSKWVEEL